MAKKIKELTELMIEGAENDKLFAELKAGYLALDNECYSQAWEHFYNLYSYDNKSDSSMREYKGRGAYGLCRVMQECPNEDELVTQLMETDADLIRRSKTKVVSRDYARKYIGRKYLVFAADQCEYESAIMEYALNCVGHGRKKSFVFDYNDRDAQVGLHWANRLLASKDAECKAIGHIVHAKYHFGLFTRAKSKEECRLFCENVIAARDLVGEDNEYVQYFLAHVCANPNFKDYQDGEYYDPKKGYQLFKRVVETAEDPDLVYSANNIKAMLETKYPSKIGPSN